MELSVRDLSSVLLKPEEALAKQVSGKTKAAVLVPIFISGKDLSAVFTKRGHDLPKHAGEISFPGGRPDPEDEDLRSTALRETEEEIGLPTERVEIIGALPPTATFITGYAIYPFVGLIQEGFDFKPNPAEVEFVLELALSDLVLAKKQKRLLRKGVPIRNDVYEIAGNLIWGATARMLTSLINRVQPLMAGS